jgi:hypothetical protein
MISSGSLVFCLLSKNVNVYYNFICCFVWALPPLKEEHGLRQYGNVLLKRIFRPKREKVTGLEKIT